MVSIPFGTELVNLLFYCPSFSPYGNVRKLVLQLVVWAAGVTM